MKNIFYLSLVVFSFMYIPNGEAQVKVNVNINAQPLWGPIGYDYVRYYYMPEIDVYYNVQNQKYTFWNGKKWVTKSKLPSRYRNVDLFRTYKVVINADQPWRRHEINRERYRPFRHNHSQVVIKDKRKEFNRDFSSSRRDMSHKEKIQNDRHSRR